MSTSASNRITLPTDMAGKKALPASPGYRMAEVDDVILPIFLFDKLWKCQEDGGNKFCARRVQTDFGIQTIGAE